MIDAQKKIEEYKLKKQIASDKFSKVQAFYMEIKDFDDDLETEIGKYGCKTMLNDLNGLIARFKKEIKKWETIQQS